MCERAHMHNVHAHAHVHVLVHVVNTDVHAWHLICRYDPFTFDSAVHKKASAAALGMPHSIEGSGASKGAVAKPAFIDPAAAAQGATRGTKRSPPSPSAAQTAQKKGKPALHSSTEACPAPSTAPEFAVAPVRATSVAAAVRGLPPAGETGAEVALEKLRGLASKRGSCERNR